MTAPALVLEKFFDPHHRDRYPCCGPPAMVCPACGFEGLAGSSGGMLYPPPQKGLAEEVCESCATAGPDELKARMKAHADTLMDRASWLLVYSRWGDIKFDPNLYIVGPDELAC